MILASHVVPERGAPRIRMGAAKVSPLNAVRRSPGQANGMRGHGIRWGALKTLNRLRLL